MSNVAEEALTRAVTSQSMTNYPAIFRGFMAKGIPEADIDPRRNVFTFHAWKALGRVVKKGEHGGRITTFRPIPEKKDEAGKVTRKAGSMPWFTTVFHVSQVRPIDGTETDPPPVRDVQKEVFGD